VAVDVKQATFASGTKNDPAAGPNRDPAESSADEQFMLVAVDLASASPGKPSTEPAADLSQFDPQGAQVGASAQAPALGSPGRDRSLAGAGLSRDPGESSTDEQLMLVALDLASWSPGRASIERASDSSQARPEGAQGSGSARAPAPSEYGSLDWGKASDHVVKTHDGTSTFPDSPGRGRKPRASSGGAGGSGARARRARPTKHQDSVRTVAEHVTIDMGQPGGADALLFGEGSPGMSHDLSSPPRIGGYVYWECPWPDAAAHAGIDHAVVHVTVDVTAGGRPTAAHLIDQPGYEFGEDALRCAMDQKYFPGRDAAGMPVDGRTDKFSVRFNRRKTGIVVAP
jgi:hypothetical protein